MSRRPAFPNIFRVEGIQRVTPESRVTCPKCGSRNLRAVWREPDEADCLGCWSRVRVKSVPELEPLGGRPVQTGGVRLS